MLYSIGSKLKSIVVAITFLYLEFYGNTPGVLGWLWPRR